MNTLPNYDTWKLACPDDGRDAPDMASTLEDMATSPDTFDNWLSGNVLPQSVAGLLSLILDRGLPSMNKSECDDNLRDVYETRIGNVIDDFEAWAERDTHGQNTSPAYLWRQEERWRGQGNR